MFDLTKRLLGHKLQRRHAAQTIDEIIKPEHAEQLKLMEFRQNATSWDAWFGSERGANSVVEKFVLGIGEYFTKHGGVNFLEFGMYHPELGPMTVSIQRAKGKTPAQLVSEAKRELAAERDRRERLAAALTLDAEILVAFAGTLEEAGRPNTSKWAATRAEAIRALLIELKETA